MPCSSFNNTPDSLLGSGPACSSTVRKFKGTKTSGHTMKETGTSLMTRYTFKTKSHTNPSTFITTRIQDLERMERPVVGAIRLGLRRPWAAIRVMLTKALPTLYSSFLLPLPPFLSLKTHLTHKHTHTPINACTNAHSNCLCVLPTLNMLSQLSSWVWGVIVAWGDIRGPRSQALGSNSPRL